LIAWSSFSYGQTGIIDMTSDPTIIGNNEHYQWVSDFNGHNLRHKVPLKNNQTHQLDSLIVRQFNPFGPDAGSTDFTKVLYLYEDNRDIFVTYNRDVVNGVWVPSNYGVFNYNDENDLISSSGNLWDGDFSNFDEEDPLALRTYFYNEDNQLIERHAQSQSELRANRLGSVNNFIYNDDGLIESIEFRRWSFQEDSLILESRFIYTYYDQLLEQFVAFDNDGNRGYYATDSILYTHNNIGLLDLEFRYFKSSISDLWFKDFEQVLKYDNEGKLEKIESRDFSDNIPTPKDTTFYHYNSYGSLMDITYVSTDSTEFERLGVLPHVRGKQEYNYNNEVAYDQVKQLRSHVPEYQENHMLTEETELMDLIGPMYGEINLTEINYTQFFYSEIKGTSTEVITGDQSIFTVSPNPSSNVIEVSSPENYGSEFYLQLIDINGRIVMEQPVHTKEKISISHLSSGTYIYVVDYDERKSVGKLVVH